MERRTKNLAIGCLAGCGLFGTVMLIVAVMTIAALTAVGNSLNDLFEGVAMEVEGGGGQE